MHFLMPIKLTDSSYQKTPLIMFVAIFGQDFLVELVEKGGGEYSHSLKQPFFLSLFTFDEIQVGP